MISTTSVTRFGEISPLQQNLISIWLFLGVVSIRQHFEPPLAISMICLSIGQIFMVVKAKYWKMTLPSRHTVAVIVTTLPTLSTSSARSTARAATIAEFWGSWSRRTSRDPPRPFWPPRRWSWQQPRGWFLRPGSRQGSWIKIYDLIY